MPWKSPRAPFLVPLLLLLLLGDAACTTLAWGWVTRTDPPLGDFKEYRQDLEFPNLLSGLGTEADGREALENAIASVLRRVTYPLRQGRDGPEFGQPFRNVVDQVHGIDPQAQVTLVGGTEGLLSYLYSRLEQDPARKEPGWSVKAALRGIASENGPIAANDALGPIQRLGLHIQSRSPEHRPALEAAVRDSFAGPAAHFGRPTVASGPDDVGKLQFHAEVSGTPPSSGPRALDLQLLGFNLSKGVLLSTGAADSGEAVQRLIEGQIRFLAGSVQALTPGELVESGFYWARNPWLRLENEAELVEAAREAASRLNIGQWTELEQRIVENSRFGLAHNRYYRARYGIRHGALGKTNLSIPFYQLDVPLELRAPLPPLRGLWTVEKYFGGKDPVVYHATKGVATVQRIANQGFSLLSGTATTDAGVGLYALRDPGRFYQRGAGATYGLRLKRDPRVRILDWDQFSRYDPLFPEVEKKAARRGLDTNVVLADEYGIDLIARTSRRSGQQELLVMNRGALDPSGQDRVIEDESEYLASNGIWNDQNSEVPFESLLRWRKIRASLGYQDNWAELDSRLEKRFEYLARPRDPTWSQLSDIEKRHLGIALSLAPLFRFPGRDELIQHAIKHPSFASGTLSVILAFDSPDDQRRLAPLVAEYFAARDMTEKAWKPAAFKALEFAQHPSPILRQAGLEALWRIPKELRESDQFWAERQLSPGLDCDIQVRKRALELLRRNPGPPVKANPRVQCLESGLTSGPVPAVGYPR